MANRRQFLAGSVACSALMTSKAARAGSILQGAPGKALAGFVYDDRFADGPAIAQGLVQHAAATYAVRGDVAEVWYDKLAPDLRQGARAIGGLTTAGSLFVLARLGHDAGLILALHGQHRLAQGGEAEQLAMDAPDLVKRGYDAALKSGMPWKLALQAALIETASAQFTSHQILNGMGPYAMDRQTTLHSWLLVPRAGLLAGQVRFGQ